MPVPGADRYGAVLVRNLVAQWNEAARMIAIDQQLSLGDSARLMALVNLAAADAAIAVWDSKRFFNFWRPITAIREGNNDLNPFTIGDPGWTPFIQGPHFPAGSQTPPYPDYVSGANALTGALTRILQLYFRTDHFRFEVNKATPPAVVICENPRTYQRSRTPPRKWLTRASCSAFTSDLPTKTRGSSVAASPAGRSRTPETAPPREALSRQRNHRRLEGGRPPGGLLARPSEPSARLAHPHLVEQRLVLAPALTDLHEQAQEHLGAEEVLDLLAGLAADELEHRAAACRSGSPSGCRARPGSRTGSAPGPAPP